MLFFKEFELILILAILNDIRDVYNWGIFKF